MERPGPGPGPAAGRAERFEDEKRRIIESCFSKKEADGSLIETYITHIRITEYASHPSSPAPPQARAPGVEKPRVIIVAVRKSGRVRMHKSKENANGTYSIGKTWNLDDLSRIEGYTAPETNPTFREWAGERGFLITLGKPYFWQAQTDKERKFFIASLVKIYGKYTGGKCPEVVGFEQKEYDQIMGAGRRPPGQPPPRPPPDQAASQPPSQVPSQVPSQASSISSGPPPVPGGFPNEPRFAKTPPVRPNPNGTNSPAGSVDSSTSREKPPAPRWMMTQNNRSQDSVANSFMTRSEDASSLPPRSRNGMPGPGAFAQFTDPPKTLPPQEPLPTPPRPQPLSNDQPPPERRRPPMDPSRPQDRDLVPPPLMSPPKREPMAPPPRSSERMSPRRESVGQQSVPSSLTGAVQEREAPSPAPQVAPPEIVKSAPPPVPGLFKRPSPPQSLQKPTGPLSLRSPSPASITEEAPAPASAPAPSTQAEAENNTEDEGRPGLGPMIRAKKSRGEIAGTIWAAASAAAAFRPRPGGAGDRLRQLQSKTSDGPDGITDVVPAPPRPESRDNREPPPEPPKSPGRNPQVPDVKITVPKPSRPSSVQGPVIESKATKEGGQKLDKPNEEPRRSAATGNDARYLRSLGIGTTLLDERSAEFGKWLDYFGWVPGEQMRTRNVEEMRVDLERELNKAQAGGWLARFREEDERVDAIKQGIDLAITECEELDNLLTLYSVELSTLSDDIAYIEAQGQGLQVQTANQKLLKKELESLLETCAITTHDLEALRLAPLENIQGLEEVENSLVTLFKAMSKIDPSLGGDSIKAADVTMDSEQTFGLNSDYRQMRIVQEKKQMYEQESGIFMRRLVDVMQQQFNAAFSETRRSLEGALSKKADTTHHDVGRDLLWKYSPLMLYARDADLENWNRLLQIYQDQSAPLYRGEFQNLIAVWRRNARPTTGEEQELLFTSQAEKQQEGGVATTARKLTVKRSGTLARALRSPLSDNVNRASMDKAGLDSRSLPYEIFAGVLDDLLPLVEMEQNFITDFFHATTLEQVDFPEAVAASRPADRRGGDLKRHRLMEPDRELARRVTRAMEIIFSFLEQEVQRLMEWVVGQDPLQGIGVLAALEKKSSEMGQSNQDFVNTVLQKLYGHLEGRFKKFVDEQMRAIEDTKVKIKKRKGVISFFRIFPLFSAAVENMVGDLDPNLGVRRTIDREYDRILKTMFDSLMVIARENPAVGVAAGSADPEDKEALNFHILLIENMNHFLEETDTRGLDILEEWKEQANSTYHEHVDLYLNAVMRRPLGKVLEQLENIEAQLQSGRSPSAIAAQTSNSKSTFNKCLGNYDSKEVRKGIEALRKRVEKHFGDADDPGLSRDLVVKVTTECENFYGNVENRIGMITTDVYGGDVLFEWPRADVKAAFR